MCLLGRLLGTSAENSWRCAAEVLMTKTSKNLLYVELVNPDSPIFWTHTKVSTQPAAGRFTTNFSKCSLKQPAKKMQASCQLTKYDNGGDIYWWHT